MFSKEQHLMQMLTCESCAKLANEDRLRSTAVKSKSCLQHDRILLVNTGPMCITKSLVMLDSMHTTTSLDALNPVRITASLVALNPVHITIFTSQSVHSIRKSLQYYDGVLKTAAVLADTVVVGS